MLDERDYIYHQDFVTDADKASYTRFLSNLLKDNAYVKMAYMTGILPIAKYSSGSELNMFCEYTIVTLENNNLGNYWTSSGPYGNVHFPRGQKNDFWLPVFCFEYFNNILEKLNLLNFVINKTEFLHHGKRTFLGMFKES